MNTRNPLWDTSRSVCGPGRGVVVALAAALLLVSPLSDARSGRVKAPPEPAAPAERVLRLDLVAPELTTLPFDGDLDTALVWVRQRLDAVYGPRIKAALDTRERSRLRHAMADELRTLRDGLVSFDGSRTGYEVSIVAGEFVPGAEEQILLYREGQIDHYLFFSHGKLWKYARPLAAREPFPQRLATFLADQGEATEQTLGESDEDGVTAARWQGRRHILRLQDRRLLYSADLLVVEARAIADHIAELRGGRTADTAGGAVDPDLEDFLEAGGDDE